MVESLPNLRRQLAGLLGGVITLAQFQEWYWDHFDTIEQHGTDADVDLLNLVFLVLAEYTSDYIDASQLLDGLRTDPQVQEALSTDAAAVA